MSTSTAIRRVVGKVKLTTGVVMSVVKRSRETLAPKAAAGLGSTSMGDRDPRRGELSPHQHWTLKTEQTLVATLLTSHSRWYVPHTYKANCTSNNHSSTAS